MAAFVLICCAKTFLKESKTVFLAPPPPDFPPSTPVNEVSLNPTAYK